MRTTHHAAQLAHYSPGRMRLRVPSAKGDREALQGIRRAISSVNGVSEVSVNESLGTVTICYDHSNHDELHRLLTSGEARQQVILTSCPRLADLGHVDEMIEKEAEFLAGHSHAAKALLQMVNRLDQGVKRATGNAVDLKVIAPLALAVGAFVELGVTAATPVWLTLGLFSFNHFIDLHAHRPHKDPITQQTDEGEPAPRGTNPDRCRT
jgi:hypothetical protein